MRIQLNVSNSLVDSPGAGSPEGTGLMEERGGGDPNIVIIIIIKYLYSAYTFKF